MSRATAFESRTDWSEASAALSRRGTAGFGCADANSYFPPPRCEMTDEREKSLANAIATIEKSYGKSSIMRLGSRDILVPVSVIPSGCLSIDAALGVGGFPRGRVIEIYGPESGGKTTMTLHVIAEAQKLGGQAAFIDAEHALDPIYARKLGVDVDNLLVSQPDNGEQALEIAETLIRSGGVDIVVVDSVAALVPKAELEGDMGDPQMGLQARLMSQALRTRTKVVKNKVAAPFREAEFDIVYGEGISREGDLIDLGVEKGVLEKSGTWISFGGERMGQGRENARVFLKENKDIRDKLENMLRKRLEIPMPGNSNAAGAGPNGHAAPAQGEKPPMKTSAATAGADTSKARPTR